MDKRIQHQTGFTLIEILMVVILLGILASIILPSVIQSNEEAKLNSLKTNLALMRSAIETYHYQHKNTYPGIKKKNGSPSQNPNDAVTGFILQLTRYTDLDGEAKEEKDATHLYGPYITGGRLPNNPFNDKNDLTCDITTTDISARSSDGLTGWKFYTRTGILMANDGAHDGL